MLVVLGSVAYEALQGSVAPAVAYAFIATGAGVAVMGAIDDRRSLSNAIRLPVWLVLAAGATWLIGGLPSLDLGSFSLPLGAFGGIIAVLGIVWLINLYNFMDGIDGMAGAQAVIAGAAGGAMLLTAGEPGLAAVSFAIAAGCAGFLVWNWPPAKIFMGDVGSGFLGCAFALLAIASDRAGAVPIIVWAILLGPFLIDATFTLARRVARREPFHQPHRTHVYQLWVGSGKPHRNVTLAYAAVSLCLVPVAFAAWTIPVVRLPAAFFCAAALGAAWWRLRTALSRKG